MAEGYPHLLETASVYRLCKRLAATSGPLRFCALCDSNVARCAVTKGRSPSLGLAKGLKRIAAVCLSYGLYPQLPFCPTRIMPADHPTRDAPYPDPGSTFVPANATRAQLAALRSLSRVRRWLANWTRLVCLLSHSLPVCYPNPRDCTRAWRTFVPSPLEFDASLGFPGEGPSTFFRVGVWGFQGFWVCFSSSVVLSHGMRPRNTGDEIRQVARTPLPLPQGRPVEAKTQKARDALWVQFLTWLEAAGIDRALFLETAGLVDVDSINAVLAKFGRELYQAGRPYSHFSETLNAFTAKVPKLRRLLQLAWDVAFAWRRLEPGQHHTAMPWQVLLACISAAILWGWPRVAAILALSWGGLLRIGEVLSATRRDLLLPHDVEHTADLFFWR